MTGNSPIKTRAAAYATTYLALIAVLAAFGFGIMVGRRGEVPVSTGEPSAKNTARLFNIDRTKDRDVDFNQFWQVWDRLKSGHLKKDTIKDVDLFYGAIEGMVASVGDPYSNYFPPRAAEEFVKSFSGEFEGVGAEIGVKQNQLVVVAPLPNTPAEKAGLRRGDKILAIDHELTLGLSVGAAVERIRGPAGSTTTLTITREGLTKPKDVVLTRRKINVPAVMTEWKDDKKIMHLRVMQFNDSTMPEFNRAVAAFKRAGGQGLILDLRNNPGGYLEGAVEMGSAWITEGPIVTEKFSTGEATAHPAEPPHPLAGVKTVVLVNGGSASASEIVAGALQDTGAAIIIGEKTFGKGSVQDYIPFPDGSALKMTVAEWITPQGNQINDKGIVPDIEVKEKFEEEKVGEDAMVEKALELLKK